MKSVPGAVATGSVAGMSAHLDRGDPVATAPGTDFITKLASLHLSLGPLSLWAIHDVQQASRNRGRVALQADKAAVDRGRGKNRSRCDRARAARALLRH